MKTPIRYAARGAVLALSLAFAHTAAADSYATGFNAALAGDYRTAAANWASLANGNDGRAQFHLALLYHAGLHVDQDEKIAVQLYRAAAENGVPEAQEYLAVAYTHGWFGLPQDEKRAAHWMARLGQIPAKQIAQR